MLRSRCLGALQIGRAVSARQSGLADPADSRTRAHHRCSEAQPNVVTDSEELHPVAGAQHRLDASTWATSCAHRSRVSAGCVFGAAFCKAQPHRRARWSGTGGPSDIV